MYRWMIIPAACVLLTLAGRASAQQFAPGLPNGKGGVVSSTGSFSSLMSQSMQKPNFSAMSTRPAFPSPLNLFNMMPSFPNLQNTIMLRNVFGPQTSVTLPKQAPPPPKKK